MQAKPDQENPDSTTDDLEWDTAERITDDLIDRGFICGHPDRGDVAATVQALQRAGYIEGGPVTDPTPERKQRSDWALTLYATMALGLTARLGVTMAEDRPHWETAYWIVLVALNIREVIRRLEVRRG